MKDFFVRVYNNCKEFLNSLRIRITIWYFCGDNKIICSRLVFALFFIASITSTPSIEVDAMHYPVLVNITEHYIEDPLVGILNRTLQLYRFFG